MKQNNIGFNDLVKILNVSPTQVAKIQKGRANLRLATMAHIFSTLSYNALAKLGLDGLEQPQGLPVISILC
jgi:transcriptional regulator with XRE-family HTH domain